MQSLPAEFTLPTARVSRRPGTVPDKVKGKVKASWITGPNVYTLTTKSEKEAPLWSLKYPTVNRKPVEEDSFMWQFENSLASAFGVIPSHMLEAWNDFDPGSSLQEYRRYAQRDLFPTLDFLKAKKPQFVLPEILYKSLRGKHKYYISKRREDLCVLHEALNNMITRDPTGQAVHDKSDVDLSRQIDTLEKVAAQVADAVAHTSAWGKGKKYRAVDGSNLNGINLQSEDLSGVPCHEGVSHRKFKRRFLHTEIECTTPIFTIGTTAWLCNILVDEHCNFAGFNHIQDAGFVPRDWVQVPFVYSQKDYKLVYDYYTTLKHSMYSQPKLEDIERFLGPWNDAMSRNLTARGFRKPDVNLPTSPSIHQRRGWSSWGHW